MPAANTPIYVIGSINTDMVVKTDELPTPGKTVLGGEFIISAGGKGANQAVAAARLGGQVIMVGNLGTDIFGDQAISRLVEEGVNCDFIGRDENTPSGVALISVDKAGENHIVVAPGANHTLGKAQVNAALENIPQLAIVLLQLEIPLSTVEHAINELKKKNCRIILDPAPARELPTQLLDGIYLITPNEAEAEVLSAVAVKDSESALRAATPLLNNGVQNVAITLGARGVFLINSEGCEIIMAPDVEAIDTTAAGDCFNGSVAVALSGGLSLSDSIHQACKTASISVTRRGAQDSMPYACEVK